VKAARAVAEAVGRADVGLCKRLLCQSASVFQKQRHNRMLAESSAGSYGSFDMSASPPSERDWRDVLDHQKAGTEVPAVAF